MKILHTSYFAKNAKNPKAVSIALYSPSWFSGRQFKKLAPSDRLLKKYKQDGDEEYYREFYCNEVLDNLDADAIFEELGEGSVLLCWEKKGSFCHRHIVAEWFASKGVFVEEL